MSDDIKRNSTDEAFAEIAAKIDQGVEPAPRSEKAPENMMDQLKNEAAEARDRALRAQAELDNVRKRLYREMDDERKFANQALLTDLLPVMDNIGRAIEAAQKTADSGAIVDGFKMVQQHLETVFGKYNCKRIAALHKPFDPHLHMAIMQQASEHPAGTIILVAQEGFQLHERVLRPSQVIVSTGPATS